MSQRWHTRGRPVVYCAPNPATALLEVLVHLEIDLEDLPTHYRFLLLPLVVMLAALFFPLPLTEQEAGGGESADGTREAPSRA